MIFYNTAENSLEVERAILHDFSSYFKTIEETKNWRDPGEKIYRVEVTVSEVEE